MPNVELDLGGYTIGGTTIFAILAALVILPTVLLEGLSLLSYVSTSGALASTVFLLSIVEWHHCWNWISWEGNTFQVE